MKTSIFDMTFVLPPMLEMTEVVKDMPGIRMCDTDVPNKLSLLNCGCKETDMKTSIFDMR